MWIAASAAKAQDLFALKARATPANEVAQAVVGDDQAPPPAQSHIPANGRVHRVVRIDDLPWIEAMSDDPSTPAQAQIAIPDVKHLQFVPPNGVLVSAPATFDQEFAGPVFRLEGKLSVEPEVGSGHFIVNFHPDVNLNEARRLVLAAGALVEERPDLRASELLVAGDRAAAEALSNLDETSWVFPASEDIVQGAPVAGCPGANTTIGAVGEYVANIGEGWDGPGAGAANLHFGFQSFSAKIPADQIRSEFQRAMAEWSRYAQVNFTEGGAANALKRLNVIFGAGAHGDAYPFDGRGRVLAHTFYPSPPNPEPIAGDLHFDEDENWKVGADVDFFSVALHELGHALGLGHSDRPSAVMYAYYRRTTTLTEEDIGAILGLYAKRTASTPSPTPANPAAPTPPQTPPPSPPSKPASPTPTPTPNPTSPTSDAVPPSLKIGAPAGSFVVTTAAAITLSGTAIDNVAVARITWQPRGGIETPAEGTTNWTARDVPLIKGTNYLTLRVYDAAGNSSWRSLTVTRR